MPCQPIDNSQIFPPPFPAGFPSNFAPPQPSLVNPFPSTPIDDFLQLFEEINMILPSGTLYPNLSANHSRQELDAVLSLLEQFTPFLMAYTFFMPILNMILCIIEVLCALLNPFKLVKALKRLFRNCIPEFLSLFPLIAVVMMIISLLLLILTLIEYIIERLVRIILMIIDNVETLAKAVERFDNDSIVSITNKIGNLLCGLQNLFALFGTILVIINIIKALLNLDFKIPPCDSGDNSDDGCCTPDVCPSFIKNNTTITRTTGTLQYFNEVSVDSGLTLPPGFGLITSDKRKESWQFYDASLPIELAFNNITHAFDLPAGVSKVFYPEDTTYPITSIPGTVPYNLDLRLLYNPTMFGRTDPKGTRFIRIKGCILTGAPIDGVMNYNNDLVSPFNGTLSLTGGFAYEDDGITPASVDEKTQGNINSFIHIPAITGSNPTLNPTDGYLYENVEYTFTINHEVLFANSLITLSCIPDLASDRDFINATISAPLAANAAKFANIALPDVEGATQCVLNAINTYKQSISIDSTNKFQSDILNCLNNLKNEVANSLSDVIDVGFNQYSSTFVLEPTIQFTTLPIVVKVILNEKSGNNMAHNIPASTGATLASKIKANISFGKISEFVYDGYDYFTANLTSSTSGNGEITISYDNMVIGILNNPSDVTQTPSVSPKVLNYTFVHSAVPDVAERRDVGDVADD